MFTWDKKNVHFIFVCAGNVAFRHRIYVKYLFKTWALYKHNPFLVTAFKIKRILAIFYLYIYSHVFTWKNLYKFLEDSLSIRILIDQGVWWTSASVYCTSRPVYKSVCCPDLSGIVEQCSPCYHCRKSMLSVPSKM